VRRRDDWSDHEHLRLALCDREQEPRHVSGVNSIPLGRTEGTLRIWVLHTDCAKIIGRGGRTLREVETKSHTKLKVQREDEMGSSKERHVDIIGTAREQKSALKIILDLSVFCRDAEGILKDTREAEEAESTLVLEVLPEEVGRVLGRKGETVKLLERDSGAKIDVDKTTGRLEIVGSEESRERAQEVVLAEVSFAKGLDGIVLKDTPRARPRPDDPDEPPPLKIWVRNRDAGRVIGRGGETIREIMEKTGADIKVQKSDDVTVEREIAIFGDPEQREKALELVLNGVSWARGEKRMLKPSPESKLREEPPERRRKRRRRETPEEPKEKEPPPPAPEHGPNSGLWVCGTCGGDHRTKDCPHTSGLLGVGMQIGMQMGLQAMGMQSLQMGMHMGAAMGPVGMPVVPPSESSSSHEGSDSESVGTLRSHSRSPGRTPAPRCAVRSASPAEARPSSPRRVKQTKEELPDLPSPRSRRSRAAQPGVRSCSPTAGSSRHQPRVAPRSLSQAGPQVKKAPSKQARSQKNIDVSDL